MDNAQQQPRANRQTPALRDDRAQRENETINGGNQKKIPATGEPGCGNQCSTVTGLKIKLENRWQRKPAVTPDLFFEPSSS
jgi:hypothetical protein